MADQLAFPQYRCIPGPHGSAHYTFDGGMTLRDYFAAKAMQGMMDAAMPMSEIAPVAYEMADEMLKAREAK